MLQVVGQADLLRAGRLALEGRGVHGHFGVAVCENPQGIALGQVVRKLRTHADGDRLHDADAPLRVLQRAAAEHPLKAGDQAALGVDLVDAKEDVQGLLRGLHGLAGNAHAQERGDLFDLLGGHGDHHKDAAARHKVRDLPLAAEGERVEPLDCDGLKIGLARFVDGIDARVEQALDAGLIAVHKRQMASGAGQNFGAEAPAHLARADDNRLSLASHASPPSAYTQLHYLFIISSDLPFRKEKTVKSTVFFIGRHSSIGRNGVSKMVAERCALWYTQGVETAFCMVERRAQEETHHGKSHRSVH